MKTAGKEYCSLCIAERVNIFCHMSDSKKSKKLMNKKSELTGKCSCNARFLRLYLQGRGGADEASSSCRKLAFSEICVPEGEQIRNGKKNQRRNKKRVDPPKD